MSQPDFYVAPPNGEIRRLVSSSVDGKKIHVDRIDVYNAFAREMFVKGIKARWSDPGARFCFEGDDTSSETALSDKLLRAAEVVDQASLDEIEGAGEISYEWQTFAELEDDETEQRYLVEDVVTEGQGGVVGGRYKSLKTSIAEDLNASMATGIAFLDRFAVPEAIPCGMMTAESGKATVRETMMRIAAAKGITRRELADRLLISAKLPKLTTADHLEAIERDIRKYGLRCLTIDPSYLALGEAGDSVSNVYKMGGLLSPITKIIQATGCTILLLNHTEQKGRGKDIGKFDPPELGEISMSGFAEWARFWILLAAQREWDEHAARHWLWMRLGGSAGHSGLWSLEVTEGQRSDPGGRRWDVIVSTASGARQERERQAENQKAQKQERTEAEHVRKLQAALLAFPQGETARALREASGLNSGNFGTAIRSLLNTGKADKIDIVKRGQSYDGYQPRG